MYLSTSFLRKCCATIQHNFTYIAGVSKSKTISVRTRREKNNLAWRDFWVIGLLEGQALLQSLVYCPITAVGYVPPLSVFRKFWYASEYHILRLNNLHDVWKKKKRCLDRTLLIKTLILTFVLKSKNAELD